MTDSTAAYILSVVALLFATAAIALLWSVESALQSQRKVNRAASDLITSIGHRIDLVQEEVHLLRRMIIKLPSDPQ